MALIKCTCRWNDQVETVVLVDPFCTAHCTCLPELLDPTCPRHPGT